jgi:hypothetical protein
MGMRKPLSRRSAAFSLAIAICGFAAAEGKTANIVIDPSADFASTPYTISFGGGMATYTFANIYDPSSDPLTADAVSTGGDGLVNAFVSKPVPLQLGSVIGNTGYDFTAFPSPVGIPYSIAEDSIGLKFFLADGVHYGFVTTLGPEVIQYGYNSTPGAFIAVGTPEPATWVMLIVGLGALGASARIRTCRTLREVEDQFTSLII